VSSQLYHAANFKLAVGSWQLAIGN